MITPRISCAIRGGVLRTFHPSPISLRTYANKKNMQATQGQASPGTAGNVTEPISASPEEQAINKSRGTGSKDSPDSKGLAEPVSSPKGSTVGQQTEDTSTQEAFKQDPNKSDSEKRKAVEEKGQRKLDPADN